MREFLVLELLEGYFTTKYSLNLIPQIFLELIHQHIIERERVRTSETLLLPILREE